MKPIGPEREVRARSSGLGFPHGGVDRGHRHVPSRDPWEKPSHGDASTFPLMGGAEKRRTLSPSDLAA